MLKSCYRFSGKFPGRHFQLVEHRRGWSLLPAQCEAGTILSDPLAKALDLVTSDFVYARFIGDRKDDIEAKSRRWDNVIEHETPEMTVWASELKKLVNKGVKTYAFFNNHYAGFASGSAKLFEDLWDKSWITPICIAEFHHMFFRRLDALPFFE